MELRELLIGRPLRSEEEQREQIGPLAGIPVLGLDALGSAAYGPEAALTVLLPLGIAATSYIGPITICTGALLFAVFLSYLQTIPAYPSGGGSYTVAKENLGAFAGLLAASALCLDYILNVAVAIAAGVGALVSAAPVLLPHTLWICLGLLCALTIINLRGIRTTGLLFMIPTYLFIGTLLSTFGIGLVKTFLAHGAPAPLTPPPGPPPHARQLVTLWLLMHAFASGCTALTGVEAVSNAVPIFRKPTVHNARRTLSSLVILLAALLAGVALLCRSYGITATVPDQPGYQSILSQIVSAVMGRGWFYYLTMGSVIAVLCLSANTSFADFPRVCRMLALDAYLPAEFAHRGSRLVYTSGIVVLSVLAAALLLAFRGVTDRLIPLFAVGAFGAFTASQVGMVMHWRRARERRTGSLILNTVGACTTGVALLIIIAAKFREGAWIVLVVIPLVLFVFRRIWMYQTSVEEKTDSEGPLDFQHLPVPIVVIPIKRLDGVGRKALRLAMRLTPDVHVVQVLSEDIKTEDLEAEWSETVARPAQNAGFCPPRLVFIKSAYREFFGPLLDYLARLAQENPERLIGVMVPELVEKRWYHFLFRHRATLLKGLLLMEGGPQIFIINTPWYIEKRTTLPEGAPEAVEVRVAA